MKMTVYNLYIFDQKGSLLYYGEWCRKKQAGMTREEEGKFMYGMLYSIKSFVARMSPTDVKEGFQLYRTSKYRLNYLETPTRYTFVLNTDTAAPCVKDVLQNIYSQVFVEHYIKNPACKPGEAITSELFKTKLEEVVKESPAYSFKPI